MFNSSGSCDPYFQGIGLAWPQKSKCSLGWTQRLKGIGDRRERNCPVCTMVVQCARVGRGE
jgi:hypothetical protein